MDPSRFFSGKLSAYGLRFVFEIFLGSFLTTPCGHNCGLSTVYTIFLFRQVRKGGVFLYETCGDVVGMAVTYSRPCISETEEETRTLCYKFGYPEIRYDVLPQFSSLVYLQPWSSPRKFRPGPGDLRSRIWGHIGQQLQYHNF